jgi:hypothetical protein
VSLAHLGLGPDIGHIFGHSNNEQLAYCQPVIYGTFRFYIVKKSSTLTHSCPA